MSASIKPKVGDMLMVAEEDNYLGDPVVVEMLLRAMASALLKERQLNIGTGSSIEDGHATAMSNIFLGKDPEFAAMKEWNKPGGIDVFIASALNIQDIDPEDRMKTFFLMFVIDVYKLVQYADEPGVLDEQWMPQIAGIVDFYRDLLIGYKPELEV